jgi:hypothetical protein
MAQPVFWMVVPNGKGREVLAAVEHVAAGTFVDWSIGRRIAKLTIPERGLVRYESRKRRRRCHILKPK